MKEIPTKEQLELIQNARIDSDRMIIGVLAIIIIAAMWFIVIGTGIENRVVDGLLGSTLPAFILIIQFFFRTSGHKK